MSRRGNPELYVPKRAQKTKIDLIWEKYGLPELRDLLFSAAAGAVVAILIIAICFITGFRVKTEESDTGTVYHYFGWMFRGEPTLGLMRCSDGRNAGVRGGTFYYSDGSTYSGDSVDLMRHGQGVMTFSDGSRYEGNFEYDLYSGYGRYTGADGSSYDGYYEDGLYSGEGTLRFSDGSVYKGTFSEGEKSGQGSMTYGNGDTFVGTFENDMRAQGIYTWKSGESLEGKFSNNLPPYYEKIIYTDASGSTYKAYYRDGSLYEKQPYSKPVVDEEPDEEPGGNETPTGPVG